MSIKCPIYEVVKVENLLASYECQTCEYFNDCLQDMAEDMSEEMLGIASKYIAEMQDTIKEHMKVKKGEAECVKR